MSPATLGPRQQQAARPPPRHRRTACRSAISRPRTSRRTQSPGSRRSDSSRSSGAASSAIRSSRPPIASRGPPVVDLTDEQQAALGDADRARVGEDYHAALLHGVTGSGKTEIYLRLARAVREAGRGVLLMVPEIALTPAAAAHLPRRVRRARRHPAQRPLRRRALRPVAAHPPRRRRRRRRHAQRGLRAAREPRADRRRRRARRLVQAGREPALPRARRRGRPRPAAGALVVLGSATPSLESYHNARGRPVRRSDAAPPRAGSPDGARARSSTCARSSPPEGPDVILSATLRDAMTARLERGEQAIVLLNRRGFATVVFCRECGETLECPNCSVTLTVHKARRARPLPLLQPLGAAAEGRAASAPARFSSSSASGPSASRRKSARCFPRARVGRVDRDTIRRRGAIARAPREVRRAASSTSSSARR